MFSCSALGDPFPSVTWSFNGTTLSNGAKYQIETNGQDFGRLTIVDTTFNDRGEYRCTYNNTVGSASTTVMLTVQGTVCVLKDLCLIFVFLVRPQFVSIFVPAAGIAGGAINFTCTALGFPTPSISWNRNGLPFTAGSQAGVSITPSALVLPEPEMISERTSTLQITGLVLSDVADYSCLAENNLARPQQQESTRENFGVLCKLVNNPKKYFIIFV